MELPHHPGLLLKAWTLNSEPDSWNLAECRGGGEGDGESVALRVASRLAQPSFVPSLLPAVGEAYLLVPAEVLRR